MPKTAVIYARFSCSKQREESIEGQLRICHEWAEREGYEVVAEYCDRAVSGRTDARPEFQRMIANAGESDIVLVYMMDRFSRDIYDAPLYKKMLHDHGVRVVSATETLPDGPEAMIIENIYEAMAAMESAKTSLRTKRSMHEHAAKRRHNGVWTFGFRTNPDSKEYEVDPHWGPFVLEGLKRRKQLESHESIAADFAERGVKTYRGNPCSPSMVEHMLMNERYRGVYIFGDVRIEGGMPRIVPDDLFWEVQNVKAKRTERGEEWSEYALRRKAICGGCAREMVGKGARNHAGTKYDYYACTHCDMKSVRRDWLEREVANGVRDLLSDPEEALRVARIAVEASDTSDVDRMREQAEKSLRSAENGLRNIVNAVEEGMSWSMVEERADALEKQKQRALRDLEACEERTVDVDKLALFLQEGATLDDETLLKAFVYRVIVEKESITVILNYDDQNNYEPATFTVERVRRINDWLPG